MNERIRSLLDRAEYQARKYPGPDWEVYVEPSREQILEKFAELIVRECLSIVEPTEDSGDEWCVTLKGTAQEIREHFGVEE